MAKDMPQDFIRMKVLDPDAIRDWDLNLKVISDIYATYSPKWNTSKNNLIRMSLNINQ